jgi:hypothetical protein
MSQELLIATIPLILALLVKLSEENDMIPLPIVECGDHSKLRTYKDLLKIF